MKRGQRRPEGGRGGAGKGRCAEAAAGAWDRSAPLVLICRSGGRSAKAALALMALGFTQVASLRGGMLGWNAMRLPVERDAAVAQALS